MADMTIDEATADTNVTGVEKMPASDGGAPKSVTTGQIRDFILAELAASDAAEGTDLSEDGIYITQDGETKRLTGTTFAQALLDYACALIGIVGPNGNEIFVIDDSGTKKTITLTQVTAYITANAAGFFDSLTGAGTMAASDKVMVKQGGTVKEGTLGNLAAFALSTFAAFIGECYNVLNVQQTDKVVVVSGGVTKWMTVAQFQAAASGGIVPPSATTAGNIPTWGDSAGGSLAAGLAVGTSVRGQGTADNTTIPTEAAVRAAIGNGNVQGPVSTTENKIPQWSDTSKTLKDGLELANTVATPGVDTKVPTERAVRVAITDAVAGLGAGDVKGPAATTGDNIPQWDTTQKKLKDGLGVATTVGPTGSDQNIPTEKAVRAAIAAEATARGTAIASEATARDAAITAAIAAEATARGTAISTAVADKATSPSTTTENKIPQWSDTAKALKDGLVVATSVASTGSDQNIPTEKAVRTAITAAVAAEATARGTAISTAVADKATAPSTTTQNKVPQWDATQKKLKDGLSVVTAVDSTGSNTAIPTEKAVRAAIAAEATARGTAISTAVAGLGAGDVQKSGTPANGTLAKWTSGGKIESGPSVTASVGSTGTDTTVPTEKAVRTAITNATAGMVTKSGTPTAGKLAKFNGENTVTNGPDVTTSVGTTGADTAVPTEKAVRTAIAAALATAAADATSKANAAQAAAEATIGEKVSAPSSHTEDAIPTWGASNELKAGKEVATVLASNGSDGRIPTEKAVRDALPVAATTAADGLMTAADKAKLDGIVDTSAVAEIGNDSPLNDSDVLTILKGGTTWMKALMTRFWTYIMGKLATYRIDDLMEGEDNTDLDANATRHGLCPKFPGGTEKFLRGDGAFAVPNGSTAFDGDTGDGGSAGLVPAPAGGDAAANKFLSASGAWAVPPSAAGVDIPGSTAIDEADGADALICWDASANAYRKVSLAQVLALAAAKVRYDTIFIPAGAMIPGATAPATAGAVTFTNAKHDTMAFNATASQTAEFDLVLPDGWDGGALKAKFLWTAYDSTKAEQGEGVAWQIGCTATPDEGAVTLAPTAWTAKTDTLSQVNELHRTTATAAFTPEGTIETGGLLHFTVKRDNTEGAVSGAPLDTDALLLGVLIQYGKTEDVVQW